MMRCLRMGCVLVLCSAIGGCGLSAMQKEDIRRWEAEAADLGHPDVKFVEALSPSTAMGLGFAPFGIGGFYVRRPGLGVSGILCWPLSITWSPAMAYSTANQHNYRLLRDRVTTLRMEDQARRPPMEAGHSISSRLKEIDTLHREGRISDAEYQQSRRRILEDVR